MSLLLIEGFEGYGTTPGDRPLPIGVMARRYVMEGESAMDIEAGRIDGYCLQFNSNNDYVGMSFTNTNDTVIIGFAVKVGEWHKQDIVCLYEGSNLGISVALTTSGEAVIDMAGTPLETTSGLGLGLDTWHWCELKVVVDNTGSYELKINGDVVLSDASVDTQPGANSYYNLFKLSTLGFTHGGYPYFDDIYICNGAGAANNDYLGNSHIYALYPDGAGNSAEWTPLAGDNYANIDETLVDDDTTYVESNTSNQVDTYTYDDIATDLLTIHGIQINTDCRETDVDPYTLKTTVRSGGSDYDDAGQSLGTTDYVTKRLISETDPNTSNEWIDTDLNSAEFGFTVG